MGTDSPPAKREVFLGLLGQGWVSVILDARRDGVVLPAHLKAQPQLRLDYGLDMPTPIEGLDVGETGIRATLSFNRQAHATFVPWTAVYVVAQADGAGVLYPEAIPPELAGSLEAATAQKIQLNGQDEQNAPEDSAAAASPPAGAGVSDSKTASAQEGGEGVANADLDGKTRVDAGANQLPRFSLVPPDADAPARNGNDSDNGSDRDSDREISDAPLDGPRAGSKRRRKPRLRLVK